MPPKHDLQAWMTRVNGILNSTYLRLHVRCCQMSNTEKEFDAVAMMRAARDRISGEIEGMTLEEELKWLASQAIDDPFLKRLRDRAAQQQHAADGAEH